ncbi:peptidoglycan editing factor PgeF [Zavarzinia aquatilis]|uniref:Purine nucleoside phosphorylase n=1 Tax=Zavarzinia aquatilis TaxID=2211142 RepID=A0A317EJN7_9PROT|nr:peptidoglycan editing factor PgeF [Zavarzinia aquatilis]PWR25623.1 peptidoglycan editing factor PgeF [Zavarzinia aquatilis]
MTQPPVFSASCLSGLSHGFYGRRGGVSEGIYSSLNCGLGSSDAREAVLENRERIAGALGAGALLSLHQIHSTEVVTVDAPWAPGEGPKADAMVTARKGLALGILTADCAPILFADKQAGVIGAAHAGWKGALGGIAEATVAAMVALGAAPSRISAVIGPCIGRSSYEVGPEFEARFIESDGAAAAAFFHRPDPAGRPYFDLPAFVADRLRRAGIGTIELTGLDTFAGEADFFSFRRTTHRGEGDYGREVAAIMLD